MRKEHDDEAQKNDAEGVGEGCGQPHDDGVFDVAVLPHEVSGHERFPMSRCKGVSDSQKKGHEESDKKPRYRKVTPDE